MKTGELYQLKSEAEMLAFGKNLIQKFDDGGVFFLRGDLGVGKTTLVRGCLRALGYNAAVKSPTYTIVEEYYINNKCAFHFDLYRLESAQELEYLGIRDYLLEKNAYIFVEWPDKGLSFLPKPDLTLEINYVNNGRELKLM